MTRLQDKHTLITGGSTGIGLETARRFLAEGAHVAITGRDPQRLEVARTQLGPQVLAIASDAGDPAAQQALAAHLKQAWGSLDAVFLNAGDVTHAPLEAWDEATYDRLMATNLKGPFFLLQALLPLLANPSSVILCGSVSAHIGLATSSAYAASKAGLLSLARTLSGELHPRGIRVNGLSPGPTHTPAFDKLAQSPQEQAAMVKSIKALVPIGRLGRADEIAAAAVFLASDESSFMYGSEMLVDGGAGSL